MTRLVFGVHPPAGSMRPPLPRGGSAKLWQTCALIAAVVGRALWSASSRSAFSPGHLGTRAVLMLVSNAVCVFAEVCDQRVPSLSVLQQRRTRLPPRCGTPPSRPSSDTSSAHCPSCPSTHGAAAIAYTVPLPAVASSLYMYKLQPLHHSSCILRIGLCSLFAGCPLMGFRHSTIYHCETSVQNKKYFSIFV